MNKTKKIDVIIPTYHPDEKLERCLRMLKRQTIQPQRIMLINTDEEFFHSKVFSTLKQGEIVHITKPEFDHGGTRNQAARMCDGEIMILLTQDAIPADEYLIENLLKPFEDEEVCAAYGRQMADKKDNPIEAYTRIFNYPKESRIKSKEDLPKLGIKTFFCSNVCAAYRKSEYNALGGFPLHTIFNEDMIFASHLIEAGKKIAYAADAKVVHSHNYGCLAQLHRNFDLGVSQAQHPEIFDAYPSEGEGIRMVKKSASYVCKIHKPWLLVTLFFQSGFKYVGYFLGKRYKSLPDGVIRWCTSNKTWWEYHGKIRKKRNRR